MFLPTTGQWTAYLPVTVIMTVGLVLTWNSTNIDWNETLSLKDPFWTCRSLDEESRNILLLRASFFSSQIQQPLPHTSLGIGKPKHQYPPWSQTLWFHQEEGRGRGDNAGYLCHVPDSTPWRRLWHNVCRRITDKWEYIGILIPRTHNSTAPPFFLSPLSPTPALPLR